MFSRSTKPKLLDMPRLARRYYTSGLQYACGIEGRMKSIPWAPEEQGGQKFLLVDPLPCQRRAVTK